MLFCVALDWDVNLIKNKAMKKISSFLAVIIFVCSNLQSQPTIQWQKNYNGYGSHRANASMDMVVDQLGNVIATGYNYDTIWDGNTDIVTIKYDSNGNVLWTQILNIGTMETPYKVEVDNNNDLVITGYVTMPYMTGFIAKYSSSGTFLWSKIITPINTSYSHWFSSIKFDATNNIYVSGMGSAIFFSKLSPTGTVLWTIDDPAISLYTYYTLVGEFDIDNFGNIYISGVEVTEDSVGWDPADNDYILSKYDSNGNLIWAKKDTASGFGSYYSYPFSNSVKCVGGNVFVGNPFPVDNPLCAANTDSRAIVFSKYDLNGNLIAKNQFMNPGSIYNYPRNMNFNGYDFFIGGITTTDPTMNDIESLIIKVDTNCNFVWGKTLDANSYQEEIIDVATDNSGNVFGVGTIYSPSGYTYMFSAAFDGSGSTLWYLPYNVGPYTGASGIEVNSNGIYVSATQSLFSGTSDYLTIKYNYVAEINEHFQKDGLLIYPNPNNGVFEIENSSNFQIESISIYDIAGKIILNKNLENEIKIIDVSNFDNGCYFFIAHMSDGSLKSEKFIIAK